MVFPRNVGGRALAECGVCGDDDKNGMRGDVLVRRARWLVAALASRHRGLACKVLVLRACFVGGARVAVYPSTEKTDRVGIRPGVSVRAVEVRIEFEFVLPAEVCVSVTAWRPLIHAVRINMKIAFVCSQHDAGLSTQSTRVDDSPRRPTTRFAGQRRVKS